MRGHQAVRCSARDGGFVMTIIPDLPSTEKQASLARPSQATA